MPKIIISGCNGRMGQVVERMCNARENVTVVAGFDVNAEKKSNYPVYSDPMEYTGKADVLVDFSNPAALDGLLKYCIKNKLPAVLCTTGYSEEQIAAIGEASKQVPIFKSGNMSLGINLLLSLVKKAVSVLGTNYDIEIVERHHRMKVDAPSGTALMLADAAKSALPYAPEYTYERQSVRQQRGDHEIGISAVRGGTIVGEHEVIFAGTDEVIELKHSANSREVFATGAVTAALYMAGITEPGLYDMSSVVENS